MIHFEQTLSVKCYYKGTKIKQNGDKSTMLPAILHDIPLMTNCGANGGITFEINQGDQCLLLHTDRDLNLWLKNGKQNELESFATHQLKDAIAIVGPKNTLKKIAEYNNLATTVWYKKTQLIVSDLVTLENENANLKTLLDDNIKNQTDTLSHLKDAVD